jgi:hypothetical protein
VQTGDNVMIGGFSISGASPMTIFVRARGPSLAPFFPNNYLSNPVLQLFSGQNLVSDNDDWGSAPNMTAIQATGMAPGNALESADLPGFFGPVVT